VERSVGKACAKALEHFAGDIHAVQLAGSTRDKVAPMATGPDADVDDHLAAHVFFREERRPDLAFES
jgi:hypothetical protein